MNNYPVIRSERCCMTIMTAEDVNWLYELFNDEDVKINLEGVRLFSGSKEATAVFIDSMVDAYHTERGFLWKIMYDATPVGFICTADFDDSPYISYAMIPKFRNLGLMTESIEAILDYQNAIDYKQYSISVKKNNILSYRLCNYLARKYNIMVGL